jgi:hypothetical protein
VINLSAVIVVNRLHNQLHHHRRLVIQFLEVNFQTFVWTGNGITIMNKILHFNTHQNQNTVGNIFSGQVVGETAKNLSDRFGKVLQLRQSMTINRQDKSTSLSTQLDSLIPASKISNLTQGVFVGAVSDNFEERIEQKIFHAEIVVDNAKVAAETKAYKMIPEIASFVDNDGNDNMKLEIDKNYNRIKQEVAKIIIDEMERIRNNPDLSHLVKK